MKSSSISMSHEQLPTELVYPIAIDNTRISDLRPTIPDIQRTDETVFTTHTNARGLNEEDTSNTDDDTGGHDSNKENARPAADTDGAILCDTSEHKESTQLDDSGCECSTGARAADCRTAERLGERDEGTQIHSSGDSGNPGESWENDKRILRDLGDSKPLLEFIAEEDSRRTRSYEYIKSREDIHARIAHVCRNAGLVIHDRDRARLARLWGILRDFRIVKALAIHSRNIFNYHCADLIEVYVNIAELQFTEAPTPAGQLDQLGIDLLQRILAANVEEYYDDALTDVEKDSWGPNLKTRSTSDARKIIFLHSCKERYIVPDGHFALEIVSKAHATAAEITELSKKVLMGMKNTK